MAAYNYFLTLILIIGTSSMLTGMDFEQSSQQSLAMNDALNKNLQTMKSLTEKLNTASSPLDTSLAPLLQAFITVRNALMGMMAWSEQRDYFRKETDAQVAMVKNFILINLDTIKESQKSFMHDSYETIKQAARTVHALFSAGWLETVGLYVPEPRIEGIAECVAAYKNLISIGNRARENRIFLAFIEQIHQMRIANEGVVLSLQPIIDQEIAANEQLQEELNKPLLECTNALQKFIANNSALIEKKYEDFQKLANPQSFAAITTTLQKVNTLTLLVSQFQSALNTVNVNNLPVETTDFSNQMDKLLNLLAAADFSLMQAFIPNNPTDKNEQLLYARMPVTRQRENVTCSLRSITNTRAINAAVADAARTNTPLWSNAIEKATQSLKAEILKQCTETRNAEDLIDLLKLYPVGDAMIVEIMRDTLNSPTNPYGLIIHVVRDNKIDISAPPFALTEKIIDKQSGETTWIPAGSLAKVDFKKIVEEIEKSTLAVTNDLKNALAQNSYTYPIFILDGPNLHWFSLAVTRIAGKVPVLYFMDSGSAELLTNNMATVSTRTTWFIFDLFYTIISNIIKK